MNKASSVSFGLIVIGDEILSGMRRDRHFEFFRHLLAGKGFSVAWLQLLPDDPGLLSRRLRETMAEGLPVFSCGGIGATPDDYTRQCAADAAGLPLVRHQGAAALIEKHFGDRAYPHRICMADFPAGSELIPNPYNEVAGFSINEHYFLPGFPDMAHPMGEWVLETYYSRPPEALRELSLRVYGVSENDLMPLLTELSGACPGCKLFSLPRIGKERFVELGFRGRQGVDEAFTRLKKGLAKLGHSFSEE